MMTGGFLFKEQLSRDVAYQLSPNMLISLVDNWTFLVLLAFRCRRILCFFTRQIKLNYWIILSVWLR